MKTLPLSLSVLALTAASLPLSAQTAKPAAPAATKPAVTKPATPAAAHKPAVVACVAHPEVTDKVPALPAGATCIKTLYTIVSAPNVKLENISPMENETALKETLGIESTKISLDYVDVKVGTGELAAPHKFYSIHYTGYLTDGTKFDSSLDRGEPIVIPYGGHQVIPGWDTGFDGMKVGGKRRLYIPFQLAYGTQAKGPIPAKSELIFDVEFVAQSDTKPEPKPAPAATTVPVPPAGAPKPANAPADAKPATPAPATPAPAPATPAAAPAATPAPSTK